MGEPQTPHFYDFGTFERASSSQNRLFSSLETSGHQKQDQEIPWKVCLIYKSQVSEFQNPFCLKRRALGND